MKKLAAVDVESRRVKIKLKRHHKTRLKNLIAANNLLEAVQDGIVQGLVGDHPVLVFRRDFAAKQGGECV